MTSKVLLILANGWVPWDCGISKGVCLARISVSTHISQIKVKGTRKFKKLLHQELKVLYTFIFAVLSRIIRRFVCCCVQSYRRIFREVFQTILCLVFIVLPSAFPGAVYAREVLQRTFVLNWVRDFQLFFHSTFLHLH